MRQRTDSLYSFLFIIKSVFNFYFNSFQYLKFEEYLNLFINISTLPFSFR